MRLVEIFTEYVPVVNGKGQMGRYDQKFIIEKKPNPKILTVEDLENYVRNLQRRYPRNQFYLRKTKYMDKTFYVITRKSYIKTEDGRRKWVKERIPIYFDLENQKFYVPESYLKRMPKLANYIIMVTLGALGISQSKYIG